MIRSKSSCKWQKLTCLQWVCSFIRSRLTANVAPAHCGLQSACALTSPFSISGPGVVVPLMWGGYLYLRHSDGILQDHRMQQRDHCRLLRAVQSAEDQPSCPTSTAQMWTATVSSWPATLVKWAMQPLFTHMDIRKVSYPFACVLLAGKCRYLCYKEAFTLLLTSRKQSK